MPKNNKKKEGKQKKSKPEEEVADYEPDAEEDYPVEGGDGDDYSSASSSDEDDDGKVELEGVIKTTDSDDEDEISSEEEEAEPAPKKLKSSSTSNASDKGKAKKATKKKSKKDDESGEIINVEFLFRDMDECFFHGLKTLLISSNPLHVVHSSELTDLMIENISVGTIISNDDDCVFGFASVLSLTSPEVTQKSCIKYLKKTCLDKCPSQHKQEMETVLSGKTKRPAGFYIHGRMINLPLEITEVLHQQLVLDMDWAVENAEGGEEERKSLDFGAFVIFAPCYEQHEKGGGTSLIYKNFEDEIFASNAEFTYSFDTPKSFATEDKQVCTVIVITKTGHRQALKELKQMIGG